MLTRHSDEMLTHVKATPCGAKDPASLSFSFFLLLALDPRWQDCREGFSLSLSVNFWRDSHSVLLLHMERNLPRDIHSQLSDPELLELCRTELTRTNSDSSAVTVDTSKDISQHCVAPSPQDLLTKWTDQQHSLYLNSLEASFVNELYRSKCLRSWKVQNNLKEADKSGALQISRNMPGQFLILQDGCWKKISHERNEPMLESTAASHVLAGSPLKITAAERGCAMREFAVHHCGLCCDESHIRGSSIFSGRSPRSSRKCYLESVGSTAEFSDQNFKDDEDQRARSSHMPVEKRLKIETVDDASRNDQVVPLGKFYSTELSTSNNPSSENKEQHELLSELPASFLAPKSDIHCFLRGS